MSNTELLATWIVTAIKIFFWIFMAMLAFGVFIWTIMGIVYVCRAIGRMFKAIGRGIARGARACVAPLIRHAPP